MPIYQINDILLDKYRIERLLGQGAFGEVYLAVHNHLNVRRALKVLRRGAEGVGSSLYAEGRARFQLESQLGAQVNHPHLIQVHDFDDAEGEMFLAMEFAPGGSLQKRITSARESSQPIPLAEITRTAREVAEGLAVLHQREVVHRDLKPSNILFGADGSAKIADLGLAQIPGGASIRSRLSVVEHHPGTPAYMSPEQESSFAYLPPASDVYTLGLILFELLCGRSYRGLRPGTRASSLRADTPAWLDDLLAAMLAKDPEQRPWNGQELAERLQAGGSQPAKTSPPHETSDFAKTEDDHHRAKRAQQERARQQAVELARRAEEEELARERLADFRQRLKAWWQRNAKRLGIGVASIVALAALGWAVSWLPRYVQTQNLKITQTALAQPLPQATQTAVKVKTQTPMQTAVLPKTQPMRPSAVFSLTPTPLATQTPTWSSTPTLGIGSTQVSTKDGMVMLYVPAGEFLMGWKDGDMDEKPEHNVYLDAYWIDQTEVTNAQYERCVAEAKCNPSFPGAFYTRGTGYCNYRVDNFDNCPVLFVDWYQASAYCTWAGRHLPSEAEWEKAARGTDERIYPWGDAEPVDNLLNFDNPYGGSKANAVGSYPLGASPYGALDMAGNVWEWVADWFGEYPSESVTNPVGPGSGVYRVLRGGSWASNRSFVRTTDRFPRNPGYPGDRYGFRCAR